jgi:uncharacterized damage-inducible protein DinB
MNRKYLGGVFAFALLALAPNFAAHAQMTDGQAPKIAPGTQIDPRTTFDAQLTAFEQEFTAAAKAMPAEKYGFLPANTSATDFRGVRTFGAEVAHVAEANYFYGSAFGRLPYPPEAKGLDKLTGKDEILSALAASFAFAHKAVANLTKDNAFESIRGNQTRASLAGGLVAHGFDHYGQMVEYLRMNGIVPPASAK